MGDNGPSFLGGEVGCRDSCRVGCRDSCRVGGEVVPSTVCASTVCASTYRTATLGVIRDMRYRV